MTIRFMYDGINSLAAGIAAQFPNAQAVAGYLNGQFEWSETEWALFPNSQHITIAVNVQNYGHVLDVENGDASPNQTQDWITMRKQAGLVIPTIYCNRFTLPLVRIGTGKWIAGQDYDIWCADFTGTPHQVLSDQPTGVRPYMCAATQYESTARWDKSALYVDNWPRQCSA